MTQFLSDGFESGDFSEWTGQWVSDGSSSVAGDWKHSGSYAGKFVVSANDGYADTYKNIGSRTTAYHRAYVRFSALPTTGKSVVLLFLGDSGNNPIMALGLKYSGGSAKFFAAYLKDGTIVNLFSSANTPQINTDYCIEIKASVGSSSGSVESWVDGVKDDGLSDTSGFDNDDGGNITYAFVGCDNYVEENYPLTVWVDDVVTADSYVGPQSGSGTDLAVTGNLMVNGNTDLGGQLTTDATICNKGYYNLRDTDGSWINAVLIENTSPNTDFHIAPNFETQSGGTSRVFFGYGSDWGSYNWMSGFYGGNPITLMSLDSTGALTSKNNTLDDGSGKMIITGKFEMACTAPSYRWSSMEEYQANFEKYLWKLEWNGSQWNWTAMNYILPLGDSFIRFKDSAASDKYVDIGIIQTETALQDRTLWISNHLIVKKDFSCGGAASVMQGALILGSDWAADDPKGQMPQIVLSHSEGNPYPENPKRDMLQIWRAGHIGFGDLEINNLTAHGDRVITIDGYSQINWNTLATEQWEDLGSIRFNRVDSQKTFIHGIEVKTTMQEFQNGQETIMLPILDVIYLDPALQGGFQALQEIYPNGSVKIWGDFLYYGSLIPFDFIDDFTAVRAMKTTFDGNGRTIHDPETLKFLQDDKGFFSLGACIGWELSVQQKFLQEIDSMKKEITGLKLELININERRN